MNLTSIAFLVTTALFSQVKPDANHKAQTSLDVTQDAVHYERVAAQAREELKRLEKELDRYDREARKQEADQARTAVSAAEAHLRDAEKRCHAALNQNDAANAAALDEADRLDQELVLRRKELRHAQMALEVAHSIPDADRERLLQRVETCRSNIERAAAAAKNFREWAAALEQAERRKDLLRQMKSADESRPAAGGKR